MDDLIGITAIGGGRVRASIHYNPLTNPELTRTAPYIDLTRKNALRVAWWILRCSLRRAPSGNL